MAKYSIDETTLTGIAGAIRTKKGYASSYTMTPAQMITEINSISGLDIGDDFFLLAENIGTSMDEFLVSDFPTGGQIRLIGFDWTVSNLKIVKKFCDKLDLMMGIDDNGQMLSSCANSISGVIRTGGTITYYEYINFLSSITTRYPYISIDYEEVVHTTATLNYYDDDGVTLLFSEVLIDGANGTYDQTPVKENVPPGTYTFVGWGFNIGGEADPDAMIGVDRNRNIYAVYDIAKYSVSYYNDTVLIKTINNVPYGALVASVYDGVTPSFANDDGEGYIFKGWSVDRVSGPTVAYAGYTLSQGITRQYITRSNLKTIMTDATAIGSYAFYSRSDLQTAIFSKATAIGSYAFHRCSSLATISFPSVTTIETCAFEKCDALTTASFPLTTEIAIGAFSSCSSLTLLSFPLATSIGSYAFYNNHLTVASFPNATYIGAGAFNGCSLLSEVSIPLASIIEYNAFGNCYSLSGNLEFPSAETIGASAFHDCQSLEAVSFPSATSLGQSAFISCSSLRSVYFPELLTIGADAFKSCSSLESAIFPAVVSTILTGAFAYCSSLSIASFPNATSIASNVFSHCTSLTTISFPSVTNINVYAFQFCSALNEASFPLATYVGSSAFNGCSTMANASFPSVTTIGSYAFYGCLALENVYMPLLSSMGGSAFASCSSLISITFPSLRTVPLSAFYRCNSLSMASLNIASAINSSAFAWCSCLKSLYLLSTSVCKLYNSNAFYLTPITYPSDGVYGSVFVPESLVDAYKVSTNWSYISNRITAYVGGD